MKAVNRPPLLVTITYSGAVPAGLTVCAQMSPSSERYSTSIPLPGVTNTAYQAAAGFVPSRSITPALVSGEVLDTDVTSADTLAVGPLTDFQTKWNWSLMAQMSKPPALSVHLLPDSC